MSTSGNRTGSLPERLYGELIGPPPLEGLDLQGRGIEVATNLVEAAAEELSRHLEGQIGTDRGGINLFRLVPGSDPEEPLTISHDGPLEEKLLLRLPVSDVHQDWIAVGPAEGPDQAPTLIVSSFHEKMHNRSLMRTAPVAAAAPPRHRAFLASAPAAGAHRDAR